MGLIGNTSLSHIFTLLKSELDLKANDDGSMFSAKPIPDHLSLAWCEPGIYYSTSTASDAPFSTAGFILIVFNADTGVTHSTRVYTQIIMSKPASDDSFNKSKAGATYIRNVYMYWVDKLGSIPGHYDVSAGSWKKLDIMTGATSSADGFSGLVPAPVSGENTKFLRGDGTWQTAYTLPTASSSTLGGVKIGTGITIDSSGNVSVNDNSHAHTITNVTGLQTALDGKAASSHTHSSYVNQNAFSNVLVGDTTIASDTTTDTLELVAGSNVTITPDANNDKITITAKDTTYSNMKGATSSAAGTAGLVPAPVSGENTKFLRGDGTWQTAYTLPTASSSTLGGVKIGTGINVSSGTISLPTASSSTLGGVKIGTGISISSGTISLSNATSSTIGGVKVGSNITVSSGTISLTKANANTALFGSTSYFATPSNANITYTPATINMAAITDGAPASTYYGRLRSIFTSTNSSSFKGILISGRGGTSSNLDSVNGNVYLLGTDNVRVVNGMNIVTSGSVDGTTETSYGSITFRLADSSNNILYDGLHINANGTADGALYLTGTNGVIFRNSPMPSIADGVDLGRTAMRWGTFYGNSINCSSTGIFGDTVRPSTSAGASLGSSTYRWNAIYGKTANIETSITSKGTYDNTTDYNVNMYIGASGKFYRSTKTSSRKIKHDILPLQNEDLKAENLYDIEVVQFKYNDGVLSEEAQRIDTDMPGFIIEDLEKVYPIAVDKHGKEDSIYWSWNETYIIPGLVKLAQIHKERLDEQDKTISELEKRLEELEKLVLN